MGRRKTVDLSDGTLIRETKTSIYTNDMMKEIKFMTENHDLLRCEVLAILTARYPNKKITPSNLNNILSRHNIKLCEGARGKNGGKIIHGDEVNHLINDPFYTKKAVESNIPLDADIDIEDNIADDDVESISIEHHDVEDITDTKLYDEDTVFRAINEFDEPVRFDSVRKEVYGVFKAWFEDMNCVTERDFQTSDYIQLLESFIYLAENCNQIINARHDQHDIANCYQSDVVHEQENVVLEDGNTYLSDKMHIIRNTRRYIEYDSNDMNVMRPILKSIDVAGFKKVLAILKKYDADRKHPVFIPMVDKKMVQKYDWAIAGSDQSGKLARKPILVTNSRLKNRTSSYNNQARSYNRTNSSNYFKNYIINATLSNKDGEFNWQRRYYANSVEMAKEKANSDINKQFNDINILRLDVMSN